MRMRDPSHIAPARAQGSRRSVGKRTVFGRLLASARWPCLALLALAVTWLAVSAADAWSGVASACSAATAACSHNACSHDGSELPLGPSDQTSDETPDGSESPGGEERPESPETETLCVHAPVVPPPSVPDTLEVPTGSQRWARALALVSQYEPDRLERPPRA